MLPSAGFIGLGVMGKPMALNLIKGGYRLLVYGRREEAMAPLVAAGAIACGSAEEVAAGCDIVFTMVTTTAMFGKSSWENEASWPARDPVPFS
jgi:3-hydroxyisobutyrate dehydrogenase-like beta-hydroxyacid dehydrogenase